ncbi:MULTISPECIES: BMC domain-containing protein [Clostridium]|uniref:PduT-like ethanolamine utilization protein n=1 Tax=Clostridium cadaveris TaxID=1529 RepID=A0A1I2JLL4_9CLOT|nr:BMC domain-containing protein [Clostridium cadaveris]MDU4953696.1 BMC domain-containing protein [Clostridium sp.]MDM8312806.1 BMC domain-containing protein [Clostridium cadaveris]MDY4948141.1 BMC domain-containing protein [Clostridium cadaveris]NME65273.1 BMC domain-containing protein [Clostridium cadaveris]NWK10628.1 BMC domain-containing protein [Clostridium cadaveris]
MHRSIGAMEFRSISKGIEISDLIVKKSSVELILFKNICPGKFLTIISGNEGEVKESIDYGISISNGYAVDTFIVNAVHNDIILGLKNKYNVTNKGALGIIETSNVCSGIQALDKVMKDSNVSIVKMQLAFCIGGKFVSIISGEVSDVENGVRAAREAIDEKKIINISVIPSPDSMIMEMLK